MNRLIAAVRGLTFATRISRSDSQVVTLRKHSRLPPSIALHPEPTHMKNALLLSGAALIAQMVPFALNAQNVPNGDLLNWTAGVPDNWQPFADSTVTQVTAGYLDNSAARVETRSDGMGGVVIAGIAAGNTGLGFSVNSNWDSLVFYIKCQLNGSDDIDVTTGLFDAGSNLLGGGTHYLSQNHANFTRISVPFAPYTGTAANCQISLLIYDSATFMAHLGSYYIVDHFQLIGSGSGIGIGELPSLEPLRFGAFANPIDRSVDVPFDVASASAVSMQLFDLTGVEVATPMSSTVLAPGRHVAHLDSEGLSEGLYFLRLSGSSSTLTSKVVVRH